MSESRFTSRKTDAVADDQSDGGLGTQIAKWVGGIVSLTLIIGVVYWAYQLGQRDANDVPVIQAMGGVARERPEDPQGSQADHQGLDVNEVLASDETAEVGAETQIAPPPQRATPEDQPISEQPSETVVILPVVSVDEPASGTGATSDATTTEPQNVTTEDTTSQEVTVVSGDPNMTRPVRRVEPAGLSESAERVSNLIAQALDGETTEAAEDIAPQPIISTGGGAVSSVPVGTQMIQLGVFDDEQSAIRNWDFMTTNQPDLLNGLDRYIERREAGGRVFYRLRAIGFADAAAASDLCAVLMGRDVQCIPVAAR